MDRFAPGPRHLADRPRLQSLRGRLARCLRSAAGFPLIGLAVAFGCGEKRPKEDLPPPEFRRRLVERDWEDVGEWTPEELVLGLQSYVRSDDPAWPNDDGRYRDLTRFLRREKPDPDALRPLLGPDEGGEVDTRLLKRDKVARAVLHSFMGRIARDDPAAARLWDNVVYAGVHFAFEPVYAASHPAVAESLVEFFSTADIPACDESEAAFRRHFDALMEKWRARVTRKSSSMYFGILLRHVGPDAANRLYQEFAGMDANERVDLLSRTKGYEELSRASREVAVGALLDPSMEVREAAYELLESLAAPVGEFDASSRDEDIEKSLPGLRRWAAETKS